MCQNMFVNITSLKMHEEIQQKKNISYLNSMQFYWPFFTDWTGNKARLNMRCCTSFLDQLNIRQLNKENHLSSVSFSVCSDR